MALMVTMGAVLTCSMGVAPSALMVTPEKATLAMSLPAATILDNIPMKNILPFGLCRSPANPAVAAATAAPPPGVLKPQPCVPVIPAPWVPGSPTVLIGNIPALNNTSTLMCAWAGAITITSPGQTTAMVP